MSAERRLVSLKRRVNGTSRRRYGQLWAELEAEATRTGAHAWRFVSPADEAMHLEFLEFKAGADPRAGEVARRLLRELDAEAGEAEIEEWLEAR